MSNIVGFDKQKKYFKALLDGGALSHAYLFHGPEMAGKRSFVLELCGKVNGRCFSANDPDIKFISAPDAEIPISAIRELKSFFSLRPYYGPHKFAVIDDAEKLNTESSNALLKVLEEPPKFGIIFLITSKPQMLLPTILSRCEAVRCLPQGDTEILEYLGDRRINGEDRALLVELAGGRLGWVVRTLENGNLPEIKKTIEEFLKVARQGIPEKMEYAKKLSENENRQEIFIDLLNWLYAQHKKGKSAPHALRGLLKLQNILSKSEFNPRLAIENFLLHI